MGSHPVYLSADIESKGGIRMKKQYRIMEIHREILECLMDGKYRLCNIKSWDNLKRKVEFCKKKFEEKDPIIQFLKNNGVILEPVSEEACGEKDLRNAVLIREFIDHINAWKMSDFVDDLTCLIIKACFESLKMDKYFAVLYNLCSDDYEVKKSVEEWQRQMGGSVSFSDYIQRLMPDYPVYKKEDLRNYLKISLDGAENRWPVFECVNPQYADMDKEKYIRMDCAFGMGELFYKQKMDYTFYAEDIWKQCMELIDAVYA